MQCEAFKRRVADSSAFLSRRLIRLADNRSMSLPDVITIEITQEGVFADLDDPDAGCCQYREQFLRFRQVSPEEDAEVGSGRILLCKNIDVEVERMEEEDGTLRSACALLPAGLISRIRRS